MFSEGRTNGERMGQRSLISLVAPEPSEPFPNLAQPSETGSSWSADLLDQFSLIRAALEAST
jgi:hypothetical protein